MPDPAPAKAPLPYPPPPPPVVAFVITEAIIADALGPKLPFPGGVDEFEPFPAPPPPLGPLPPPPPDAETKLPKFVVPPAFQF